jgi:hypothetical protein
MAQQLSVIEQLLRDIMVDVLGFLKVSDRVKLASCSKTVQQ